MAILLAAFLMVCVSAETHEKAAHQVAQYDPTALCLRHENLASCEADQFIDCRWKTGTCVHVPPPTPHPITATPAAPPKSYTTNPVPLPPNPLPSPPSSTPPSCTPPLCIRAEKVRFQGSSTPLEMGTGVELPRNRGTSSALMAQSGSVQEEVPRFQGSSTTAPKPRPSGVPGSTKTSVSPQDIRDVQGIRPMYGGYQPI
jgi:hypothetical protein